MCKIYSSRKLAEENKQNIHFMWLSAMNRLDHNTLNYFRRDRLKDEINSFLVKWLFYLQGHGSLQTAFVDGTKIEARANR